MGAFVLPKVNVTEKVDEWGGLRLAQPVDNRNLTAGAAEQRALLGSSAVGQRALRLFGLTI